MSPYNTFQAAKRLNKLTAGFDEGFLDLKKPTIREDGHFMSPFQSAGRLMGSFWRGNSNAGRRRSNMLYNIANMNTQTTFNTVNSRLIQKNNETQPIYSRPSFNSID